jgi:membrane protease YdiL (CAAX protease family)
LINSNSNECSNTQMYHKRPQRDIFYAFLVFIVELLCLCIAGRYSDNQNIYWITGIVPTVLVITISLIRERSLKDVGFYGKHIKQDALIMLSLLAVTLIIGCTLYKMQLPFAIRNILYYFFWIALQEEIVYRGFIQSHLFSLSADSKVIILLGAMIFAISHIPYQIQTRPLDGLFILQLVIAFVWHIIFCLIVNKRENICIPLAIHVALDYLQLF